MKRVSLWITSGILALLPAVTFASPIEAAHPQDAGRVEVTWPTPNKAFDEGKGIADFVQPTSTGDPESGLFGCHRTGGERFHEGIDLKPISRDRRGEPTDSIFAAMPGIVRHISQNPGLSNYGRYIVIEHDGLNLPICTLYAHLSAIAPGLHEGERVQRGQTIGTMGRSSSEFAIPKERAHMHFEMDVLLTQDFQSWYNYRRFGSKNDHGIWNGMNLVGFDPLDFLTQLRAHKVDDFTQYLRGQAPAVRVRIATHFIPDFVKRYPALVTKPYPTQGLAGWEVIFNDVGVPFSWTPLSQMETVGLANNVPEAEPLPGYVKQRCKSLVFKKRGRYGIGKDLEANLQLLFGLRSPL
jgi:murein DD-endopeptidase MepM/ murein hydrolase activator NlpD